MNYEKEKDEKNKRPEHTPTVPTLLAVGCWLLANTNTNTKF